MKYGMQEGREVRLRDLRPYLSMKEEVKSGQWEGDRKQVDPGMACIRKTVNLTGQPDRPAKAKPQK